MAKPYSIVPPRQPIGFIDGKPVEITREWWRFFSSLFVTTGSGQPGGSGGDDNLTDLFNLAFSAIEPAGTDVDSRFSEIDLLLQACRPDPASAPASPDANALALLTSHRVQAPDARVDVLMSAARHAQAQEPRADLLLPAARHGTDFDAVTAELRKMILSIRPQRVLVGADLPNPSASSLGGTQSIAPVAHKFLTSISAFGVPAAAQPATTDLSDVVGSTAWTPVLTFGGASVGVTYASQTGSYTKIGNLTVAIGTFVLTSKGTSTGAAVITGLPAPSSTASQGSVTIVNHTSMATVNNFECRVSTTTPNISLGNSSSTSVVALADTDFTNTTRLSFVCTYLNA